MASNLEQYQQGLHFSVVGTIGDVIEFDGEDKTKQRLVRIGTADRTYSIFVDSDEELRKFAGLNGQVVRIIGTLLRVKNSASAKPRMTAIQTKDQPGWREPAYDEVLDGCVVQGVIRIIDKRQGIGRVGPYSTVQFSAWGDVYEVQHVSDEHYSSLPEDRKQLIMVRFRTNPKLGWGERSRVSELDLVFDQFRVLPPDDSAASPRSSPAAREAKV